MLLTVMGLVFLLCGIGLVCWNEWRTSKMPPRHTLDCLDWRRRGERDTTCTAPHGTDWFAPVTAELELLTSLDHQLGFRHE